MYTLAVKREFIAQHYLTGGDFGDENEWHSHHYAVEVTLNGTDLNNHGYLVDITDIENILSTLINIYEDSTLNELPEFEGLNPSLEHFARIFYSRFTEALDLSALSGVKIKLWEDEDCWAEYSE
jgi:6-pyruvoyltetrahydropterin/6-carboxytetrahydropterin synthase